MGEPVLVPPLSPREAEDIHEVKDVAFLEAVLEFQSPASWTRSPCRGSFSPAGKGPRNTRNPMTLNLVLKTIKYSTISPNP